VRRAGALGISLLLASMLIGCSGEDEGKEQEGVRTGEVEVGGFVVRGPGGEEIIVPEVIAEREDVENYLESVRPVLWDTDRELSQLIAPNVELQDQTLTLNIEVESIERADEALKAGLEDLQALKPPEELSLLHAQLLEAYERALPAYDDILETFDTGDVNQLAEEMREGLPEIELFNATTRALLQELERVAGEDSGQEVTVGTISGEGIQGGNTNPYIRR
jgi:hypothetical protein